jgi:hypothetical protein
MITFALSDKYKGTGGSLGLDRGLLVYDDGDLLVEEGMGLGACAIQTGGYTYFASLESMKQDGNAIDAVYAIDTRLLWTFLGIRSRPVTRFIEYYITNIYMKRESAQNRILAAGEFLQKIFGINRRFAKVRRMGEIRVHWEWNGNEVLIDVSGDIRKQDFRFFVMNELGGVLFHESIADGKTGPPPTGWQTFPGGAELFDPDHAIAFTLEGKSVPANVATTLFWGRESTPKTCWAGFESEIRCKTGKFEHYVYSIKFRKVTE